MLVRLLALVYEATWLPMTPRPPWWRAFARRRWDAIVRIAPSLTDDVIEQAAGAGA